MRSVRMWIVLIVMSVLGVLVLNSASAIVPGKRFDSTGSYIIVGILFFALMRFLRVPTMRYFSKPAWGWRYVVAMVLCANLTYVQLRGEPFHTMRISQWLSGITFLLVDGFTEEVLSRGVIFGVLQRRGLPIAVIGSSLMFGLMHLNVYIGNWDPWQAYWHVMSAASFGVFACALLVVTKSMWVPIIFHSLSDAGLLFETPPTKEEETYRVSIDFWQGATHPLSVFLTFVIPALILFWIHAGTPVPHWFMRYAIKFGLVDDKVVEQVSDSTV